MPLSRLAGSDRLLPGRAVRDKKTEEPQLSLELADGDGEAIRTVGQRPLFALLKPHPKMLCRLAAISHSVRSKRAQGRQPSKGEWRISC